MRTESKNSLDKRSDVLSNPDSKIGDFEYISFSEKSIMYELLQMFSPEVQRACRITDIYLTKNNKRETEYLLRVEKKYNGEK